MAAEIGLAWARFLRFLRFLRPARTEPGGGVSLSCQVSDKRPGAAALLIIESRFRWKLATTVVV